MNKYLLLFILPLLSFLMAGCDDDEDNVIAPDPAKVAGTWEVVDQGSQQVFERGCILNINATQIHEGYGGYRGSITTYFLTADGTPKQDREFTWSCLEAENNQPLIDVVSQGETYNGDPLAGNYQYRIIKLTNTHMWWQVNAGEDKSMIKFIRRNDIVIK